MNGFILLDLDFGGSQLCHKSYVDNFGLKLLEGQSKIYCSKCHLEHVDDYNLSSFLYAIYSMSQIDESAISSYESEVFNIKFVKQNKNNVNFLSIIFLKPNIFYHFSNRLLSLHSTSILNSLSINPNNLNYKLYINEIKQNIDEVITSIIQSINKNIQCLFVMKQSNTNVSSDYYCFGSSNIESISNYERITKSLFDIVYKRNNKKQKKILNGTNDLKCIINYGNNSHLIILSSYGCDISILVNESNESSTNITTVNSSHLDDLIFIINEFLL